MNGESFPTDHQCQISIEPGNRNFTTEDDFVMDLSHHRLVRYCGKASELMIPAGVKEIDPYCFSGCSQVQVVRFEPVSELISIGSWAFYCCDDLRTITIPASVTFVGTACFNGCPLTRVSFSPGSKLDFISDAVFRGCDELESAMLPSSVRSVGIGCFSGCRKLVEFPLPFDSEVLRIEQYAFWRCSSLKSIVLPSSVEFIGERCFGYCNSLYSLTFSLPSHLRELLDLPPQLSGLVFVPDSVEILSLNGQWELSARWALIFGHESRLTEINMCRRLGFVLGCRLFSSLLQIATRTLKLLRTKLEFC
jgi:hypothetical protein